MHLTVNHSTNYHYDDNLLGLIQTTKLIPSSYNGLKIIDWEVTRNEKKGGDIFRDAEGNNVEGIAKGFLSLPVKREGKGILPEMTWKMKLFMWVKDNAPESITKYMK